MSDDPRQDEIPTQLKRDMDSLFASPVVVPPQLSNAILNRARAELARPTRRPRGMLWWAGAATAAAVIALAVRFSIPTSPKSVNIVDALHLAHEIQAGHGRDVNGDGKVDQRDIDAVAMAAVRLEGGVQ